MAHLMSIYTIKRRIRALVKIEIFIITLEIPHLGNNVLLIFAIISPALKADQISR